MDDEQRIDEIDRLRTALAAERERSERRREWIVRFYDVMVDYAMNETDPSLNDGGPWVECELALLLAAEIADTGEAKGDG